MITPQKKIKFSDSPVMRSYEQVAIDRGMVKQDEIMKKASIENKYAASEDLLLDLLKLSEGLKENNYLKEADELDRKIALYKQAKGEYSKILEEAHPEGSVEVAGASDGHGIVDTLESQHDRLMKKLFGKKATSELDNVVKKAAIVIGLDKFGQDVLSNYFYQTLFALIPLKDRLARIFEINQNVGTGQYLKTIISLIDVFKNRTSSEVISVATKILGGGVSKLNFDSFKLTMDNYINNALAHVIGWEDKLGISNKIANIKENINKVSFDISLFRNVTPEKQQEIFSMAQNVQDQIVNFLIKETEKYNLSFYADKLGKENFIYDSFVTLISKYDISKRTSEIFINTFKSYISNYIGLKFNEWKNKYGDPTIISDSGVKVIAQREFGQSFRLFVIAAFQDSIAKALGKQSISIDRIKELKDIKLLMNELAIADKHVVSLIEQEKDPESKEIYRGYDDIINGIISCLSSYSGDLETTIEQIEKIPGVPSNTGIETLKDLSVFIMSFTNDIKRLSKSSSIKNMFIKVSGPTGIPVIDPKKQNVTQTATEKDSVDEPDMSGTGVRELPEKQQPKKQISKEEEDAVKAMQSLLIKISDYMVTNKDLILNKNQKLDAGSTESLRSALSDISGLKLREGGTDGNWGYRTAFALLSVNKYLLSPFGITERLKDHNDTRGYAGQKNTIADARDNVEILKKLLTAMGGAVSSETGGQKKEEIVYDIYKNPDDGKEYKIYPKDVESLDALEKWLYSTGLFGKFNVQVVNTAPGQIGNATNIGNLSGLDTARHQMVPKASSKSKITKFAQIIQNTDNELLKAGYESYKKMFPQDYGLSFEEYSQRIRRDYLLHQKNMPNLSFEYFVKQFSGQNMPLEGSQTLVPRRDIGLSFDGWRYVLNTLKEQALNKLPLKGNTHYKYYIQDLQKLEQQLKKLTSPDRMSQQDLIQGKSIDVSDTAAVPLYDLSSLSPGTKSGSAFNGIRMTTDGKVILPNGQEMTLPQLLNALLENGQLNQSSYRRIVSNMSRLGPYFGSQRGDQSEGYQEDISPPIGPTINLRSDYWAGIIPQRRISYQTFVTYANRPVELAKLMFSGETLTIRDKLNMLLSFVNKVQNRIPQVIDEYEDLMSRYDDSRAEKLTLANSRWGASWQNALETLLMSTAKALGK